MSNKRHEVRAGLRIAGRQTYIGRPCIHGHGSERGTERYVSNNNCVACTRLWNAAADAKRRARKTIRGTMAAVEALDAVTVAGALGSLDLEARLLAIMKVSAAEWRRRQRQHEQEHGEPRTGRPLGARRRVA